VEAGRLRGVRFRGGWVLVAVAIAALAPATAPAEANGPSPLLEFVTPGSLFPVGFTATGGPVTAALNGFDSVVNCSGSHGAGKITGPRSTLSDFEFTGCKAQGGSENGQKCKTAGAGEEEIKAEAIEADLVYIDQSSRRVGMLLNPGGGIYMTFTCGGEFVEASGPFLSPVGPINLAATSFTATLSRLGATQVPSGYENALGEPRLAIPMGKRAAEPSPSTTGVELGFTIQTSASVQVKAVTAAEIEAKQRADEAAAAAAAKKRQDEEAGAAAAAAKLQREEATLKRLRQQLLSTTLEQCRKAHSKHKRVRCEKRAKKRYGSL
jgi:hypothetical protein